MEHKINFLQKDFIALVQTLSSNNLGIWGKMNAQQMIEHVSDFYKVSTNKIVFELTTPSEHLPKYKEFLYSNKEFKENTKAPVLPSEPMPIKNLSYEIAVEELKNETNCFFDFFSKNKNQLTLHPAFGILNFDEWTMLHYKHLIHHAKQFSLI